MKPRNYLVLCFVCLIFVGCFPSQLMKQFGFSNADNQQSERFDVFFEETDDGIATVPVSWPDDRSSLLQLEVYASDTLFPNGNTLTVRIENISDQPLDILIPGNMDGDGLITFLAIDSEGNVKHEFNNDRVYFFRQTSGTTKLMPGKSILRTAPFVGSNIQASKFEAVEIDKPSNFFIVARFEQSSEPEIGPVYSKPKQFRITKKRRKYD